MTTRSPALLFALAVAAVGARIDAQGFTDEAAAELLNELAASAIAKPAPPRRRVRRFEAALPREVPAAIDRIPSETLRIRIETAHGSSVRVVSRTRDRIHVRAVGSSGEWLFIRNPIDGRRVSGRYVDHRQRLVILHDEASLRDQGVARDWLEVALLGLPPRTAMHDDAQARIPTIEDVTSGVDADLLEDPLERFPGYRAVDFVDYGEELHELGHSH